MHPKILDIIIRPEIGIRPVILTGPPDAYITRMEQNGYSKVRLMGLSNLAMTYLNGTNGDEFTVWVDPDVHFLLKYYSILEQYVTEARSGLHRVYLEDGCCEFSAFITPNQVVVRVGVFRDRPFEPPWTDGIALAPETYLAMWRSIASAITAASA